MSVKRDKYEISLWEDVLVAAAGSVPEHYKEKKIAVIGSDNMTAQFRAVEPRLIENINGTNILTFKMFYAYIDNETGESKTNPFLSLLVNERKVKVLWKNKWYDLVIKACQEDSNGRSITYTCKDLYINELSKTGFSLEFNTELKNNQGAVQELAEAVLDGSDWQLAYNSSDPTQIVKQKREESVYELTGTEIVSNFTAYDENDAAVSVTSANKILVYYSVVQNQEKYCQFLFKQDNNFQKEKGSQLVVDGKCLYINLTAWDSTAQPGYLLGKNGSTTILKISTSKTVSNDYRAERLIRTQQQILDPLTGKYVYNYNYTDDDLLVYGHKETVYNDPTFVNNLLVNYKDFGSTEGWSGGTLYHILYPAFTGDNAANYSAKSYLKFTAGNYLNSGIKQSASFIPDGFQANEKYIFRFKAMSNSGDKPSGTYITSGFTPKVCAYTLSGTTYTLGTNYFTVSPASSGGDNWVEFTLTCSKSVTKKTLLSSDIGLFLVSGGTYWLEQVEFFPLTMGKNNAGDTVRINPGEMEKQSLVQTAYKYYLANQAVTSAEELEYLYVGYEDWSSASLTPIFNGNFEKIRSITAKNSNRFNLLQTLAETFECWAKFTIEHNEETGEVLYDSTGRPKKWVSFHTEIGSRNNIGFIYGIDLKTISRTINSDQITSKIIVSSNKNEFGKNGFCTIARSKENYAKDTFILNFDYYVSQGLLDLGSLNKDLYQTTDAIGYYYWLNKYNKEYDTITEETSKKKIELTKQESLLKVYSQYLTSITEEITSIESEIMGLAGTTSMSAATGYIKKNPNNTKVVSLMNQWTNLKNSLAQYTTQRTKLNQSITSLKTYLTEKGDRQEELIELIKGKHQEFYNKYSRFIQEGSWISEEYFDDDLYYLDAQSVLYTSSRPQISYDVSVLRLSALEEFKNKIFKLGDISYIQDTEFFGYTWISGVKTPYKEEVLVSEITSNFDSPENDSFQVQNYKTQFEDLFQRITATTQSLQYTSGEYQRAANAFTETGAINPITLQNSFLVNQDLVFSAQNDSVIYDSTGITVTDTSNLNKKVKVTSGGIFISIDGGTSWKSAIRGDGISTQYLTAGSINTNNISIMDGNNTSFRWDADGINAYWNNSEIGTILNKFVRFDQFGVYGLNNWVPSQTTPGVTYNPISEEQIWQDAQFALTWKGFLLRNKHGDGYIEISSEKDIVVSDGTYDRIKIGNLGDTATPIYGIQIKDASNIVVMETNDDGTLWLKDRLNVATTGTQVVRIGYLPEVKESTSIHEIINANGNFIVFEDGSILGTNVNFTGGTIGGLTIDYQSIQNESFSFDADGLHIKNGALEMYIGNERVLYVDNGNLTITGRGTFAGTIEADSGYFHGQVIADSGSIAGLLMEDGKITAPDGDLTIDGQTGRIETSNILLKNGADIDTYLSLGNAKLWNPTKSIDRYFIEITNNGEITVSLTDTGILKVGDIELNGTNSIATFGGANGIKLNGTTGEISGRNNSWLITPEYASFNKILISQGIFEVGHTQTLGGSMLFKYGTTCDKTSNTTANLDSTSIANFDIGDWVALSDSASGTTTNVKITNKVSTVLTFGTTIASNYDTITYLCSSSGTGLNNNAYFGINSQDNDANWLKKRSLTMLDLKLVDGVITAGDINLLLGDLTSVGLSGYGLYASNVYLKGSLTTKLGESSYAGINTLSSATANKFNDDNSKIVFWAGSVGTEEVNIRESKFQVTEDGSIYASQGRFEGAIITKSTIQGAEIYTSKLYGGTEDAAAALEIYGGSNDTGKILFYKERLDANPILEIGTSGFKINQQSFIEFDGNNDIVANIKNINNITSINFTNLKFENNKIYFTDSITETIDFSNDSVSFKYGSTEIFLYNQDSLEVKQNFKVGQNITYANGSTKVEYKKETNGYNLYVSS